MLKGLGVVSNITRALRSGVRGIDDELRLSHHGDEASFLGGDTRLPDHSASTTVQG